MALGSKNTKRVSLNIWNNPPDMPDLDIGNTIIELAERWRRYSASPIDRTVSPHDDMHFASDANSVEYFKVGRSAIRIIAEAMILAGRRDFGSVLDLPCGGGRITRHLMKFLPESEIFVADIDQEKE